MVVEAAVNISIVIIIIDTMRFTRACIMELGLLGFSFSLLVLSLFFSSFFSYELLWHDFAFCADFITLRCLVALKYACSNG